MDNNKAIDEIKRMADILAKSRIERKAFILMPTFEGFSIHEVSEEIGQHCIYTEVLRKRTEEESQNVSENEKAKKICIHKLEPTDIKIQGFPVIQCKCGYHEILID